MSLIITDDLLEITRVGLNEIYMNNYDAPTAIGSRIFQEKNMETATEQEMIMAGFGAIPKWNADGGGMASDKPLSGDRILFTATDYAMKWTLSHKMIRDDLYQKTGAELTKAAGLSTRHTVEQDQANIFNTGFVTNGPDGVPLFSTAHPMLNGSTQANRPVSGAALTATTLQAAIVAMARMKNHRGQPIVIDQYALVIPPELRFVAQDLLKSTGAISVVFNDGTVKPTGGSGTAVGGTTINNSLIGSVTEIIEWPYLTSTTAWFLVCKPGKTTLKMLWREKPTYDVEKDFDTKGIRNSVNFAYAPVYTSYEGTYGNPGA